MTNQYVNPDEIRRALTALAMHSPFECRIISNDKKKPLSGYFATADELLGLLERQNLNDRNVYITLQKLNSAVCNKAQYGTLKENQSATSDNDVIAYNWLFVDLDPERLAGVSSSKEELESAAELAKKVNAFMQKIGFKPPLRAISGNGYHLLYRVELANTEENKELLHRCLETLALLFDNGKVKIDTVNYNPSRICKLYGTVAQKGRHTAERPHRMAMMRNKEGEPIEVNGRDVLEKLTTYYPITEPAPRHNSYSPEQFDLEEFLQRHGISYKAQAYKGGTKYVLESCPFDNSHKAPDSAVFRAADGRLGFKCLHNSCSGYDWKAFRTFFEPDAYDRPQHHQQPDHGTMYTRHQAQKEEPAKPPVVVKPEELTNYPAALATTAPIFITDGESNVKAIENAGGTAIGVKNPTDGDLVFSVIQQQQGKHTFIMSFSKSDTWAKFEAGIQDRLKQQGNTENVYRINLCGHLDSASRYAQIDPDVFKGKVREAIQKPALAEYQQNNDKTALEDYYKEILNPERGKFYPTGFTELDKELGGGLFAGLYALGAISSLGKTTLCLQIANNLAKQGYDVLFFSLEMSRTELIAKSISRLSAFYCTDKYQNTTHALTQRQVMSGYEYKNYSAAQREALFVACEEFEEISSHLYTIEGNFDFSVEKLQRRIQQHIEVTGNRPVVFVDYLQILDFEGEIQGRKNYTDKQKTDMQVKTLKRISRDYNCPVIVISSFNRESYTQPVSMTSFKESGGIEYSCDVLLGLQYKGMDYDSTRDGNLDEKKGKTSRYKYIMELIRNINASLKAGLPAPVQVKILKNRNGARGQSVYLDFFPRFNLYTQAGKAETAQKHWEKLAPYKYNPEFDQQVKRKFSESPMFKQPELEYTPEGEGVYRITKKGESENKYPF